MGDVKYVWELSRHQFVIDLGRSWFLTGNPEDLEAAATLVRGWIADNPYGTGVNWSCALEPAFRTFSWLWAYTLTADALGRRVRHQNGWPACSTTAGSCSGISSTTPARTTT